MQRELPEPWRSFLTDVDALLTFETRFHCFGGFVTTMLYGMPRGTADVDVLAVSPVNDRDRILKQARRGGPLHRKYGVYLDLVTIASVPYEYESRLQPIFTGRFIRLRLFALDPYDLALTKISRNIQRDRDDVRFLARTVPFDLEVLRRRYEVELRPFVVAEREDLTLGLWIEMIEEDRRGR